MAIRGKTFAVAAHSACNTVVCTVFTEYICAKLTMCLAQGMHAYHVDVSHTMGDNQFSRQYCPNLLLVRNKATFI